MVLHVFNPSHDEALAFGSGAYCPSSAARRMGSAFWDIAKWWKAPDDLILRLPDDGSLKGVAAPDWERIERIEPWGWDAHIVRVLQRRGAPARLLPSAGDLARWRQLSSRRTAVALLEMLRQASEPDPAYAFLLKAESRWCTTIAEVRQAIADYGGAAMLKAPWSCSGRGVWAAAAHDAPALQRAVKVLARQGAIEAEPLYERMADFAMEYESDGRGGVRFEGYSLFATSESGGYQGNVVAPQAELEARIAAYGICTAAELQRLSQIAGSALATLVGHGYSGPLGIDMMLTPQGVHPCIEVNLRLTMGRVAIWQAQHKA